MSGFGVSLRTLLVSMSVIGLIITLTAVAWFAGGSSAPDPVAENEGRVLPAVLRVSRHASSMVATGKVSGLAAGMCAALIIAPPFGVRFKHNTTYVWILAMSANGRLIGEFPRLFAARAWGYST